MSLVLFGICLVLGAAAIAVWISVRFPQLKPQRLAVIMIHLLVAVVLGQLVPFGLLLPIDASAAIQLMADLRARPSGSRVHALITIWLLRVAQNALGGMLR